MATLIFAVCVLSLVVASRDYFVAVHELLIAVASLVRSTGSRLVDFSICGVWTQKLFYMSLFVPWHVGVFLDEGSNLCPLCWQVDS